MGQGQSILQEENPLLKIRAWCVTVLLGKYPPGAPAYKYKFEPVLLLSRSLGLGLLPPNILWDVRRSRKSSLRASLPKDPTSIRASMMSRRGAGAGDAPRVDSIVDFCKCSLVSLSRGELTRQSVVTSSQPNADSEGVFWNLAGLILQAVPVLPGRSVLFGFEVWCRTCRVRCKAPYLGASCLA